MAPRLPVLIQGRSRVKCDPRCRRGPRCYLGQDSMTANETRTKKDVVRRCGSCTELSVNECLRGLNECLTALPVKVLITDNFAQKTRTTDRLNTGCERVAKCASQKPASSTSGPLGTQLSIGRLNNINGRLNHGRPSSKRAVWQHRTRMCRPTTQVIVMQQDRGRHNERQTQSTNKHVDNSESQNYTILTHTGLAQPEVAT